MPTTDTFNSDSGLVKLELPDTLSQNDIDDLEVWIEIVLRRFKRKIKPPEFASVKEII